jgi:hypothetical protein
MDRIFDAKALSGFFLKTAEGFTELAFRFQDVKHTDVVYKP